MTQLSQDSIGTTEQHSARDAFVALAQPALQIVALEQFNLPSSLVTKALVMLFKEDPVEQALYQRQVDAWLASTDIPRSELASSSVDVGAFVKEDAYSTRLSQKIAELEAEQSLQLSA